MAGRHWPSVVFQFEWLIIELIVVGLLGWQLWSVRRAIRQDREAALKKLGEGSRDSGSRSGG